MENGVFITNINEDEYKKVNKILYNLKPSTRNEKIDIKCFHDNSEEEEIIYYIFLKSVYDNLQKRFWTEIRIEM